MKYLFIALMTVAATSLSAEELIGAAAKADPTLQERAIVPSKDHVFAVGDTVIIPRSTKRYLTGETPSRWVYYVRHRIQQVGGKRFPDGILLAGIYSWLPGNGLSLLTPELEQQLEQQVEELSAKDQQIVEHIQTIVDDAAPVVEPAKPAPAPVEEVKHEPVVVIRNDESPKTIVAVPEPAKPAKVKKEHVRQPRIEAFHRFTMGVRGGTASLMQDAEEMGDWKAGFDAAFDLQYAYYFGHRYSQKCQLGIITGASLGYARSGLKSDVNDQYTLDDKTEITITADRVKEQDGQLQLEVPVLFSVLSQQGVFFNVGPKLVLPVYSRFSQSIKNPVVSAYFPEEGVTVVDESVTGFVTSDDEKTKGSWKASTLHVMATAELGYEFKLKKTGNSLGLGVFANYSFFDLYKNNTSSESLINVGNPQAWGAPINILSATDTYATGLGFFDCGVKLAYHFNFPVKR